MDLLDKLHKWFSSVSLPEDHETVYVVIRHGDTPNGFALEFTGKASRGEELKALNPSLREAGADHRLQPGDKLQIPKDWLKS